VIGRFIEARAPRPAAAARTMEQHFGDLFALYAARIAAAPQLAA
jgi:hypothetical protein